MSHLPHFGHKKLFSFKIHNSNLKLFFNDWHQVQFKKNLIHRFKEKFKNVDLRQKKNVPLTPNFGHIKNFPQK